MAWPSNSVPAYRRFLYVVLSDDRCPRPLRSYPSGTDDVVLLQESSAISDYDNAVDHPGSSFLWVGDQHHLNREEVAQLVSYLMRWLKTGELAETSSAVTEEDLANN